MQIRSKLAVTLLELLIVITIIGVLATIAVPGYSALITRQRLRQAENNLQIIRAAERSYFLSEGQYTNNFANLRMDMSSIDNDPYTYVFTGGNPPTGAQAQDGGTPVRAINFNTAVITSP